MELIPIIEKYRTGYINLACGHNDGAVLNYLTTAMLEAYEAGKEYAYGEADRIEDEAISTDPHSN